MSSKASAASKLAMAILADLKVGVTELVEQYKETNIPLNENASVSRVCYIVERILHIGLKDIAIFGTTSLWDYLEEIRECLPNAEKLLDRIRTVQKTDIGRSRAFIRIGLNDQMLGQSLEALVWNRELTTKYFSNESILTSEEYASMMFLLLENIKNVQFAIRVDDPLLGHLHYWDLMARSTVPMAPAPKKANLPPAPVVSPSKPSEIRPEQPLPLSSTPKSVPDSPSTPQTEISSPIRNLASSPAASPITQETIPKIPLAPVPVPGNPFDDDPIDVIPASSPPPAVVEATPLATPEKLEETIDSGPVAKSPVESPTKASNLSIVVDSASSPQSSLKDSKGLMELNTSYLRPDSPTPLILADGNASNVGSSLQPFEEAPKSEMPTNQAGELSPRTPEQRRPSIGHSPVQNYVSAENLSAGRRVPVAETLRSSTSESSPKFANEEMIESSLMRAPFDNEFDLAESPSPHFGRVLYTPPGSGRIPLTPPRSSAKDARLDVLSQGMDILGTTPSQSDLPALFTSLMLQPDIPDHHKQLLHTLKKAIVLLPQLGTKQMINLNISIARDLLNAIEAVLLDAFAQMPTWEARYAALWAWLSSVSPATPHVTHILSPLAQLSLLSHVSHIARSRAFIDAAINRKCLDSIISSLVRDPRSIFDSRSLLANDSLSNIFFKLIQELKQYHFDLSENPMDPLLAPDTSSATPEPSPSLTENDVDTDAQSPPKPQEASANESMTPALGESPSTTVSATNPDYKPPSFKKRKKIVTIQDAPPTPKSKIGRSNSNPDEAVSETPAVVQVAPIPLKTEPVFTPAVVSSPTVTDSVEPSVTPSVASNLPLEKAEITSSNNMQVSNDDAQLLLGDLLASSGGSPSLSRSGASEPSARPDTSTVSGSSKWRTVFKASDTSTLSVSPTREVLSQSPKGSTSVKLPSSSKSQKNAATPFGDSSTKFTPPVGYNAGLGPNGSDNASSSSISIATSQQDATLSPTKRNRSFSSNAPAWAREIQQFPVGSYKPNTDWLGGGSGGGLSDDDIINDFDTSIPSSPPKTLPVFSSSSLSKSPPSHFPREPLPYRVLNANIIAEYQPSLKRSHIKKEKSSSAKDGDEENKDSVVILKQLEGEEAVEVDSQLYKNSNPADFFILEIVPKREMTSKNSNCSGCGQDLRKETSRWCSYSGNYYCPNCHSNKKSILPARVVQHWNFKPGKVSDYAYTHLLTNWSRPVLDVSGLVEQANERNEKSFGLPLSLPVRLPIKIPLLPRNKHSPVTVILTLNALRERLTTAAEFVRSCRTGQRLLGTMQDRLHLLWSSTLWSMLDLVEADSGKLEPLLKKTIDLFSRHVHSCDSCSGKGFVCEICTSKEVIYPFDLNTVSCPNCKGLFHESCWKSNPGKCPKCVRVRAIKMKEKLI